MDLIVPGHGDPMTDWAYVDLLAETMQSIADQTAALVAEGHDLDGVRENFDWSALEPRFTRRRSVLGGQVRCLVQAPPYWTQPGVWKPGLDNEELIPHEHGVE